MRPKRRGGLQIGEKRSRRKEERGGRRKGPFRYVVCRTRYIGRDADRRASLIEHPRLISWDRDRFAKFTYYVWREYRVRELILCKINILFKENISLK